MLHFEARVRADPEIASPIPTRARHIFEARFSPESQIYRMSQDMRKCGVLLA